MLRESEGGVVHGVGASGESNRGGVQGTHVLRESKGGAAHGAGASGESNGGGT
jgi:hypothetical protein